MTHSINRLLHILNTCLSFLVNIVNLIFDMAVRTTLLCFTVFACKIIDVQGTPFKTILKLKYFQFTGRSFFWQTPRVF